MISAPARALFLGLMLCILLRPEFAFAQSAVPDISLSGNISSHVIRQDELLQFTITIRNKSDTKNGASGAEGFTLWKLPDSYNLDDSKQICVVPLLPPRTEVCETAQAFRDSKNLVAESLAPGTAVTVQGYLKPSAVHKTSTLTAIVTWKVVGRAKNPIAVSSSQWVNLGDSQVLDTSWIGRLSLDEFLKIFAVPALLVLVGALVTGVVNVINIWREKRTHAQEQERSMRSETWKQMLPISHNYAAKFYLPLSLAAQNLVKELKHPITKPTLAFFYLLLCGKKMKATRNEIGGFYFKDLRGERLASSCWEIQRSACLGEASDDFYKAVHAAIDSFDDDVDSFEAFENNFLDTSTQPASFVDDSIGKAWGLFNTWCTDKHKVEKTAQYLKGFYAVLDYESNRPYEYWYDPKDSPAKLEVTEETQGLLQEVLAKAKYTPEQIASYFSAVVRPEIN